jgi:lactoylglutathione lyase
MSRVQLALNVSDLKESIDFYSKLFNTPPAKVKDGYANFAIENPPLKLVLFAGHGEPGTLNHIGVEVDSAGDVASAAARVAADGLAATADNGVCCYAVQEKVWVEGPDNAWEIYAVLADAPAIDAQGSCCAGSEPVASTCC